MSRDNNGVKAKVTNNAGQGSVNRGGGQAGVTQDFNNISATPREVDQSKGRGIYPSIQAGQGSVKDNGGVGNTPGTPNEHKKGYFGDSH